MDEWGGMGNLLPMFQLSKDAWGGGGGVVRRHRKPHSRWTVCMLTKNILKNKSQWEREENLL